MQEIKAALDSLKMGKEIGQGLLALKIDLEVREKIFVWLARLADVQETLLKVQSENEDLRKRLKDKEDFEQKLSGYKFEKTPGGAFVYISLKPSVHYVCPSCVNKKEIQILQDLRIVTGEFRCPGCNYNFPIERYKDETF